MAPNRLEILGQKLYGYLTDFCRTYILKSIVIEDGALPSLEKFKLVGIPELKEVPSGLYKLPKLEVFHAINMSDEFQENFNLNRGQGQWIIE